MQSMARLCFRRAAVLAVLYATTALLAGCGTPEPKAKVQKPRSKEYFSEKEYGVKASPYAHAPRLVGRNQIGKPYKVRGKWYHPKEYKQYSKVGTASWYGHAFHGRLTANGEVYNVADLTAAHPTLPLPSYARVTNLSNGSSVIVRVNDRGPFHDNRLIDLSQRAAQMLGYAKDGTAKVKVDYLGRAPLEGNDQPYLMASYKPGNQAPDPSDGLPSGVMIAMNGPTPSAGLAASALPGQPGSSPFGTAIAPAAGVTAVAANGPHLPDLGPIVPQRPGNELLIPTEIPFEIASLSYAEERMAGANEAFAALERRLSATDIVRSPPLDMSRPGPSRMQRKPGESLQAWPKSARSRSSAPCFTAGTGTPSTSIRAAATVSMRSCRLHGLMAHPTHWRFATDRHLAKAERRLRLAVDSALED